jgi:hypothetical protein
MLLEQLEIPNQSFKAKAKRKPKADPYLNISPDNLKIIQLYSDGFGAKEIADKVKVEKKISGKVKRVFLTKKAIEIRASDVRIDVKARNIVQLVKECTKRGLIK